MESGRSRGFPAVENFHKKIVKERSNVIVKSVPFWEAGASLAENRGTPLPSCL